MTLSAMPVRDALNNPTVWVALATAIGTALITAARTTLYGMLPWVRRAQRQQGERSDATAEHLRVQTRRDVIAEMDKAMELRSDYADKEAEHYEERERLTAEIDTLRGLNTEVNLQLNREKINHALTLGTLRTAIRYIAAHDLAIPAELQGVDL